MVSNRKTSSKSPLQNNAGYQSSVSGRGTNKDFVSSNSKSPTKFYADGVPSGSQTQRLSSKPGGQQQSETKRSGQGNGGYPADLAMIMNALDYKR